MELVPFDNSAVWDDFVINHPFGTVFHLTAWKKIIEESYGFKSEYYLVKENNNLLGILPSFSIKTFFGNIILSQPFGEYGSPLLKDSSLMDKVIKLFLEKFSDKKLIELKLNPFYNYNLTANHYTKALLYYLETKDKSYDFFWSKQYTKKSKLRHAVRKFQQAGFSISESKNVSEFYNLYLMTCRRQISPPHSLLFFENVFKYLKDYVRLSYIRKGERVIGGLISFVFNNSCLMWKMAFDSDYFDYSLTIPLFDNQLRFCCDNNYDRLEFGRTQPNSRNELVKLKFKPLKLNLESYIYPKINENINNPYKLLKFKKILSPFSPVITNKYIGPRIKKLLPV